MSEKLSNNLTTRFWSFYTRETRRALETGNYLYIRYIILA